MRKITADVLFLGDGQIAENFVLVFDGTGTILDIELDVSFIEPDVERLSGWIVPGFINAHCHLELSHMKDVISTGTGLIDFVNDIVRKRDMPSAQIENAVEAAVNEMLMNGIVAVGDISNTQDTFREKARGRMYFHTFVEMFDLMQPTQADEQYERYIEVFDVCPNTPVSKKSVVPHAPYSVSEKLFERITNAQGASQGTVSIHNQETLDEHLMFIDKGGNFPKWYASFGLDLDHFKPTGQASVQYALEHMNPTHRTIFVHNTLSTIEDIRAVHDWSDSAFCCTCPNANLYIENRLPDYRRFIESGAKMVVGTDSLASNWQLDILAELKTISKYASYVELTDLLTWATSNGADALGIGNDFGRLKEGSAPGINLINNIESGRLSENSSAVKII